MAIAEQFAGLKMDELIGGPLTAAADASTLLANSTADFINKVGFDNNGRVRTIAFSYQKRSMNEDGTSNLDEMKVDVPMLAIVPIPNLQIDEVNILFDMEVKQSEKSEKSMDLGASLTGSLNLGIVKVSVTGSVSAHSSNTRSSDNSAKYHVDVRATNHGTPEGLARVLDMMAVNISPMLIDSALKDGNGKELSESAKARAENLKALRLEISQLENQLSGATGVLDNHLKLLKKIGASQLNVYQTTMVGILSALEGDDEKDNKTLTYSQEMDKISQCWNSFQRQAQDFIKMLADSNSETQGVASVFALRALTSEGMADNYTESENYYSAFVSAQNNAVKAQKNVNALETSLLDKKAEYSNAIAKK